LIKRKGNWLVAGGTRVIRNTEATWVKASSRGKGSQGKTLRESDRLKKSDRFWKLTLREQRKRFGNTRRKTGEKTKADARARRKPKYRGGSS